MDHDGELDNDYDEDDAHMDDEENLIHRWSELMYEKVLSVIYSVAIGDTLLYSTNDVSMQLRLIQQEKKQSFAQKWTLFFPGKH